MSAQSRGVAVITLDNPPVNGLGYARARGIVAGLDTALADAAVKAIVITGAGKAFSGGADIREFNTPKATAEPNLLTVIRALEASDQADRRRDPQRLHGRRPRARARLPLPRRRAGRAGRAARGEARPHPRRRRHAAPAARARRRDRAQHDRQRRAGDERAARQAPGQKLFDALVRGRRCSTARGRFARKEVADARPLPLVRDLKIEHPNADAYFQFARNTVGRDGEELSRRR